MEINDRKYFSKEILTPLLSSGCLQMTIPNKPTSSKQKYFSINIFNTLEEKD
ncbi:MAG: hypothetical protein JJE21_08795 [Spirochaetaceae bacterium]|nr:hypothetical protein [Spirochaetaceae bacterium]